MKYVRAGAIGVGSIVLLTAATTSMLGIAEAASTKQNGLAVKTVNVTIKTPAASKPTIVKSYKKAAPVTKKIPTQSQVDSSKPAGSSKKSKHSSHSMSKRGETGHTIRHVLDRIDSSLAWPKTSR